MNVKLHEESLSTFRKILDISAGQEETIETIVPDSMPDIYSVTCCCATALIRSKEAEDGKATVSGLVSAAVLYCPEGENGVRRIETTIPFNAVFECSELKLESRLTASVSLASADARMLNPRKLLVRADIIISVKGYCAHNLTLYTGIDGEANGIEILTERENISIISDIREKTFVIADDLLLPPSDPPIQELICTRTELMVNDTKAVGNKLIFKGTALITLIYRSEKDGGICSAGITSSFSQIMEIDFAENSCFDITLFPTGLYYDVEASSGGDRRTVTVEMHVAAQVVAVRTEEICYIADIYSTLFRLDYKSETHILDNVLPSIAINNAIKEILRSPNDQNQILDTSACPGKITCERESCNVKFTVPVTVRAICANKEGAVSCIGGCFEFHNTAELPQDCKFSVSAITTHDISASETSDGIALRAPVSLLVSPWQEKAICCICEISYDENELIDSACRPSIVLKRVQAGESLWQLAKYYCSTSALINEANGLEASDTVEENMVLLIPKKR